MPPHSAWPQFGAPAIAPQLVETCLDVVRIWEASGDSADVVGRIAGQALRHEVGIPVRPQGSVELQRARRAFDTLLTMENPSIDPAAQVNPL